MEAHLIQQWPSAEKLSKGGNDVFHNRIMIPIKDISGKTQGFSGRAIDNDAYIKYRHIAGLQRSKLLFGEYQAAKRKEAKELYITEGFFDAIAISDKLEAPAVALMGTALTKEQIDKIGKILTRWKKAEQIYLFLDWDIPGIKATIKIIQDSNFLNLLKHHELELKIIAPLKSSDYIEEKLTANPQDPAELLRAHRRGEELFRKLSILRFKYEQELVNVLAYHNLKIPSQDDEWKKQFDVLPTQEQAEIIYTLKEFTAYLPVKERLELNKSQWLHQTILNYILKTEERPASEKKEDATRKALVAEIMDNWPSAVATAKNSRQNAEFPQNPLDWERIEKGENLYRQWFINRLNDEPRYYPAPYLRVKVPKTRGRWRTKDSPRVEDLVLSHTLLLFILKKIYNFLLTNPDSSNKCFLPHYYDPEYLYNSNACISKPKDIGVYSHQLDMKSILGKGGKNNGSILRSFWGCWCDFQKAKEKWILQNPFEENGYSYVELDIKGYYEFISRIRVEDFWAERLKEILGTDNARWLSDIISHFCFGYAYLEPGNGKVKYAHPDISIPQGPDIAHIVANAYLHNIDKKMMLKAKSGKEKAFYGRYVDDITIITKSSQKLKELIELLQKELAGIGLRLNEKAKIEKFDTEDDLLEKAVNLSRPTYMFMCPEEPDKYDEEFLNYHVDYQTGYEIERNDFRFSVRQLHKSQRNAFNIEELKRLGKLMRNDDEVRHWDFIQWAMLVWREEKIGYNNWKDFLKTWVFVDNKKNKLYPYYLEFFLEALILLFYNNPRTLFANSNIEAKKELAKNFLESHQEFYQAIEEILGLASFQELHKYSFLLCIIQASKFLNKQKEELPEINELQSLQASILSATCADINTLYPNHRIDFLNSFYKNFFDFRGTTKHKRTGQFLVALSLSWVLLSIIEKNKENEKTAEEILVKIHDYIGNDRNRVKISYMI